MDSRYEVALDEAQSIIDHHWPDLGFEMVELSNCLGRRLAMDVNAQVSVPPFNAAAMDGYAVRFEDVSTPRKRLRIVGEIQAGEDCQIELGCDEAVRLYTGSIVPDGADHIVIQEVADRLDDHVIVTNAQDRARHVRTEGGDFRAGDTVLKKGDIIGPSHVGLAAASNNPQLPVQAKPSFSIITCGNELRQPGEATKRGEIIESNSLAISSLLRASGGNVECLASARDDPADLKSKMLSVSNANFVLVIGGASVGKHDLARGVFEDIGGQFLFEKIAVRPGKPTWLGILGKQLVLGLPGNPTAAYVIALLLLKTKLDGRDALRPTKAYLRSDLEGNGAKETFTRANFELVDGKVRVAVLRDQDTSRVKALKTTNCLIRRPTGDPPRHKGDLVEILPIWLPIAALGT